jgi:hypothetical protein
MKATLAQRFEITLRSFIAHVYAVYYVAREKRQARVSKTR